MRSDEFVRLVQRSMPPREELEMHGLSDEEIESEQRTFRCILRKNGEMSSRYLSELARLVSEYDCSALEISYVRFVSPPEAHPAGLLVGFWEADPIVVVRTGGKVVAYDHADPSAAPMPCAVDSEHFLDAMAWLVEAIANRELWRKRAGKVANACAEKAGGSPYKDFFSSLSAGLDY